MKRFLAMLIAAATLTFGGMAHAEEPEPFDLNKATVEQLMAIPDANITEELAKAAQEQAMCSWRGKTELSDGRITAATAPLIYDGELYGFARCVVSMRMGDQHVTILTLAAVALAASWRLASAFARRSRLRTLS